MLKGNVFDNGANVTENLCECCTVVDTPRAARCVGVKAML